MTRDEEILEMIHGVMRDHARELTGFRVLLFGSRAEGITKERSDFDIGVAGPHPLPLEVFYRIDDPLDELPMLHHIDWVDLNNVSPDFRESALLHTKVLYDDFVKGEQS